MKRKSVVAISTLLIASSLLASCGGGSNKVTFGAYWYKDSSVSAEVGAIETLSYGVSFTPGAGIGKNYDISYSNGEYVTTFGLVEENGKTFYRLSSTMTIDVTYTFNGNTETFTDNTVSVVEFEKNTALTPIKSYSSIQSHTPQQSNKTNEISGCYTAFDYSVTVTYNGAGGNSIVVDNDTDKQMPHEFTFRDADDYTFIDNEQLYFAMRGLQPTNTTLLVYAPFSKSVQKIQANFGTKVTGEEFTFIRNDETEASKHTIDYYPVNLLLAEKNPGAPQLVKVACITNDNPKRNNNRNIILEIQTPLAYNLGTLSYKLKSAQLF